MIAQAVQFQERGKARLIEAPVPALKEDEVLIANDYTIISAGTERANLLALPNTVTSERGFPHVHGYSGAGHVIAVGTAVQDVQVGDRAVVTWGGHRSHSIQKASHVVRIQDDRVETLDAAFATIATFSLLAVRRLQIQLGETAMIAGMGLLGALALQFAELSGAQPILVADCYPKRRDLAMQLGATEVFSPDDPDFVAKVKRASGGTGPQAVVEVTGAAVALRQALEYIAFQGRLALLGCTRVSDEPIDFYKYVHKRGVSLIGVHTSTRPSHESSTGGWTEADDCRTFLKFLATGKLQVRPLLSKIVSPQDAPEIYRQLAEDSEVPLGIAFDWRSLR